MAGLDGLFNLREKAFTEALPQTAEAFLDWVDFKELNAILSELQRRSGIPEDKVRTVSKDSVKMLPYDVDYRPRSHGSNDGAKTEIQWIGDTPEDRRRPRRGLDKALTEDGPYIAFTLATLIHESLHDTARSSVPKGSISRSVSEHGRVDIGLSTLYERESTRRADNPIYSDDTEIARDRASLDEAMTEKMANDALMAYLHRKGLMRMAPKKAIEQIGKTAYQAERYVLEDLIDILADALETDRADIYHGFVRLYFSNEHRVEEVRALIDETLGNPKAGKRFDDEWAEGFEWKGPIRGVVSKRLGVGVKKRAVDRVRNSTNLSKIENLLGL